MLFNSHAFAIFILIAFLAYVAIPTWTLKKLSLLLVSYLFYAAWHPEYLLLLIGIAVVDYGLSHLVATSRSPLRRRTILAVCVILNLTILCFFKYLAFFIHCIDGLAGTDLKNTLAIPDWPLPLGISFYTFETISYVVDVYRGKTKPARSFLDYAMFLAFFPHLVAGPIVRAYDFLPQCETPRSLSRRQIGWGLGLLILGLFQKTFLADHLLSPLVDRVFESTSRATAPDVIFSTLAFSAQIYFDFSGYSLCGLGLASCFGFVLTDNFRSPYAAIGIADFWHRWHISLSTWLRDYLYISLGGSRGTSLATYRNLLVCCSGGCGMEHPLYSSSGALLTGSSCASSDSSAAHSIVSNASIPYGNLHCGWQLSGARRSHSCHWHGFLSERGRSTMRSLC